MSIKHTDGPWTVFIDDSGDEWTGWPLSINAPSVHEDCMVVRTGGQWPYKWDYAVSQAEAVANARLIAAAPELLEMAKWSESAIAPFSKDPAEKSGITRLRAAIAKAEGRK